MTFDDVYNNVYSDTPLSKISYVSRKMTAKVFWDEGEKHGREQAQRELLGQLPEIKNGPIDDVPRIMCEYIKTVEELKQKLRGEK